MNAFADFAAAVREFPILAAAALAEWADQFVLRLHRPEDMSEHQDGTGPAVCLRCGVEWPCDEWVKADARRTARTEKEKP